MSIRTLKSWNKYDGSEWTNWICLNFDKQSKENNLNFNESFRKIITTSLAVIIERAIDATYVSEFKP